MFKQSRLYLLPDLFAYLFICLFKLTDEGMTLKLGTKLPVSGSSKLFIFYVIPSRTQPAVYIGNGGGPFAAFDLWVV
jgi:hypothetical protein